MPPSPAETTRSCHYVTLIRANISSGDQEKEQEGGKGTSLAARVEDGSVRKKRTKEETSIGRRRRYRDAFHESAARWRQHSLREALLGSAPALATSSWLLRVGSVGASSSCCACGMVYCRAPARLARCRGNIQITPHRKTAYLVVVVDTTFRVRE